MLQSLSYMHTGPEAANNLEENFADGTPTTQLGELTIQSEVDLHLIAIEASEMISGWVHYLQTAQPFSKSDERYTCNMLLICAQHLSNWAYTQESHWYLPKSVEHVNKFSSTLIRIDRDIAVTYMFPAGRIFWNQLIRISARLARHYDIVPPAAALSMPIDTAVRERIRNVVFSEENGEPTQNTRESTRKSKTQFFLPSQFLKRYFILQRLFT